MKRFIMIAVSVMSIVSFIVGCDKSQNGDTKVISENATETVAKPLLTLQQSCERYAVRLCEKTKTCTLGPQGKVSDAMKEFIESTDCKDFGKGGCDMTHIDKTLPLEYVDKCLAAMNDATCEQVASPNGLSACRKIEEPVKVAMEKYELEQEKTESMGHGDHADHEGRETHDNLPALKGDIALGSRPQTLDPKMICFTFNNLLCEKNKQCVSHSGAELSAEMKEDLKKTDCRAVAAEGCPELTFGPDITFEYLTTCVDQLKRRSCEQFEGTSRFAGCEKIAEALADYYEKREANK